MVEGVGKGAGLVLLAVPIDNAFIFSQAKFQRIMSNYLGLEGSISTLATWEVGHTQHPVCDFPSYTNLFSTG